MGIIRNFFRKITGRKSQENKQTNYQDPSQPDLYLYYSSGETGTVKFGDQRTFVLEDGTQKLMQEATIVFEQLDGQQGSRFEVKNVLLEPMYMYDQNGNPYLDTKGYYQQFNANHPGTIKGFFQRRTIESMENNYIGYIGQNQDGTYNRSYDSKFRDYYRRLKEYQKQLENNSSIENIGNLTVPIEEAIKKYHGYENYGDAGVLTPNMLGERYGYNDDPR